LFFVPSFVSAQSIIEINFFFSPTCPHCAEEEKFLDKLEEKYSEITINRYSVFEKSNLDLLKGFYEKYEVSREYQGMVPITFTNNKYFVGFNEKIGKDIEGCILECKQGAVSKNNVSIIDLEGNISIPFLGEINIRKYSLPVLAFLLGVLDGFNVCSLGALVLILGLVLALGSRKKTLLFGGIFILTTAVVYGLLIFIWYQIFSYLVPYMKIMKAIIGLLGIGGAIYFFKQFLDFRKYGPTCGITPGQGIMAKFSAKFQNSLKNSANILILLGIVFLFAAIITIIEFPCSAVVPVAFAGILAQSNLSTVSYFFLIVFYLFFYLLDEIIVFLIAFFTMKIWLASSKAVTWITLLEAIILFSLGTYYLF
jgi:thiol-disulfide isomerase/thioredoxin